MKVIILAGGLPSTLIEEDEKMPKPMAEIGGRPMLWHIMKQYAHYGYNDFIICTGYKGEVIKDYFMNFYIYQSDITVDLQTNEVEIHRKQTEDWKVSIVDTGLQSSVMERLIMVRELAGDEPVLVAYGDCLSDIDIQEMIESHRRQQSLATVAIAHPTGRNEILALNEQGCYIGTKQGKKQKHSWVNACSMVLEARDLIILRKIRKTILHCRLWIVWQHMSRFRLIATKASGHRLRQFVTRPGWKTYGHSIKHRGRCGKIKLHHGRWRQREPWRVNK